MGFVGLVALAVAALAGCSVDAGSAPPPPACGGADLASDGENCGVCGRSCGGGACNAGVCGEAVVASGQAGLTGVTVTDDTLYITVEGPLDPKTGNHDGRIAKCPIDGCGEGGPQVLASGLLQPRFPTVTTDAIYVVSAGTVYTNGTAANYVPFRISLDGTEKKPMVWPTMVSSVTAIATDGARFFATTAESSKGKGDADLLECPAEGCPDYGQQITWHVTNLAGTSALALDGSYAYFTEVGTGTIARVKRTGVNVQKLFLTELAVQTLAVDDASLYWGTALPASGSANVKVQNYVARGPKEGGVREKLAATDEVVALAIDETNVYFAEATGRIARVPKAGGDVVTLATAQLEPGSLVVRSEWIYWVTRTDGAVHRLRK